MKKLLIPTLLFTNLIANAAWQRKTDLDYTCSDGKTTINFTAFYDDAVNGSSFGDVQYAYKLDIQQSSALGFEEVPGCEYALFKLEGSATGSELSFECDGDGDAGFGTIYHDYMSSDLEVEVTFPEGKPSLRYPIAEDTTYNMSCSSKF